MGKRKNRLRGKREDWGKRGGVLTSLGVKGEEKEEKETGWGELFALPENGKKGVPSSQSLLWAN